MLISDELKRLESRLKIIEPEKTENFKSLLDPIKPAENETQGKKLCHFDLLVHRKKTLPAFFNGSWQMTHRGDKWRQDASGMLNYLLAMIMNHYDKHSMMVLYDNSIAGDRCEREIFKLLHNQVKLNRLPEYGSMITKKLPEWMSVEIKPGAKKIPEY